MLLSCESKGGHITHRLMGGTGEHHAIPNQPDSGLQVLPAFLLYGIWEEGGTRGRTREQ